MDHKVLVEFTLRDKVESPDRDVSGIFFRMLDHHRGVNKCAVGDLMDEGLRLSGLTVVCWVEVDDSDNLEARK